jgi:hypothetical protein
MVDHSVVAAITLTNGRRNGEEEERKGGIEERHQSEERVDRNDLFS